MTLTYYPEYVRCVDESMKKRGIVSLAGDFWAAKQYSFLSKEVKVDPFEGSYYRDNKVGNVKNLQTKYSGVLAGSSDSRGFEKKSVISYLGKPVKQIICPKIAILIYPKQSLVVRKGRLVKDENI